MDNRTQLTAAVKIACQIASREAAQRQSASIEPLHLFIGICSVEKALSPDPGQQLPAEIRATVRTEWDSVVALFSIWGADCKSLRRAARSTLPPGSRGKPGAGKIQLSEKTQTILQWGEYARASQNEVVTLSDCLIALLEELSGPVAAVIKKQGIDPGALRNHLREVSRRLKRTEAGSHTVESPGINIFEDVPGSDPVEPPNNAGPEKPAVIPTTLDARTFNPPSPASTDPELVRRLNLLYELPLQLGSEVNLDHLLHTVVDRLIQIVPGAGRGALLVKDPHRNELLLKAHMPGEPAVSMTLARRAMDQQRGFIWERSSEDAATRVSNSEIASGMYCPLLWNGETLGVMCVDNCKTCASFTEEDLKLMVALAHYCSMAIAHRRLDEDLRRNTAILSKLLTNFSPKIRKQLLERAERGRLRLGGEKSEVTILFSDIRGFTRLSMGMEPDDIVEMLNHYLSALIEPIFRRDGTIDKFVGDAILAVFGSPELDPQQHDNAVRAALEMQQAVEELNKRRAQRSEATCKIGIGVHCGQVLHGFIGSSERMEFTVIGDAVNRASRYCEAATAGEILISPEMHQRVWTIIHASQKKINTKHEGELPAYSVSGLRKQ